MQSRKVRWNKTKKRILFMSPTVSLGLENEPQFSDFEVLQGLGEGAFGDVFKVKHKVSGKVYAIKKIRKDKIEISQMIKQVNNEVKIQYSLKYPGIVSLYNHFEDDTFLYLVLEFCEGGELYKTLQKQKRLSIKEAAKTVYDMVLALDYMHSQSPPIIHRDLKPENVLLDSKGFIKLADFGWSNTGEGTAQRKTFAGTPEYLAPEMINESGHDEKVDIWAVGIMIFELIVGKTPFVPKGYYDQTGGGDNKALSLNILNKKISFPSDFPALAKSLIKILIKTDPKRRPSAQEMLGHSWFKENINFSVFEDRQGLQASMLDVQSAYAPITISNQDQLDQYLRNWEQPSEDELLAMLREGSVLHEIKSAYNSSETLEFGDIAGASSEEFNDQQSTSGSIHPPNMFNQQENYLPSKNLSQLSRFRTSNMSGIPKKSFYNTVNGEGPEQYFNIEQKLQQKEKDLYQLESKYKVLQKKYDKQQGDSHNSSIGLLSADNSFTISSREHKEFKMLKYEIDRLKRSEQKMRTEILEKDKLIDSLKADKDSYIELQDLFKDLNSKKCSLKEDIRLKDKRIEDQQQHLFKVQEANQESQKDLHRQIADLNHKLMVKTKQNQELIIRELLEHTSESYIGIKACIQDYLRQKSQVQILKDSISEIRYQMKKEQLDADNRVETAKSTLEDEYEIKIKELHKQWRKRREDQVKKEAELRKGYQELLSVRDARIATLEADVDRQKNLLEIQAAQIDQSQDLRLQVAQMQTNYQENQRQIKSFLKSIEVLNIKNRSLEQQLLELKRHTMGAGRGNFSRTIGGKR